MTVATRIPVTRPCSAGMNSEDSAVRAKRSGPLLNRVAYTYSEAPPTALQNTNAPASALVTAQTSGAGTPWASARSAPIVASPRTAATMATIETIATTATGVEPDFGGFTFVHMD